MIEEANEIAERGPVEGEEPATANKPRVDPSQMVISRSKQQVITSESSKTQRTRSKTPPARKK